MPQWSKWGGLAVFAFAAAGLVGCTTRANNDVATGGAAGNAPRARVIGKVLNGQTQQPAGAIVTACGFGSTGTDAAGNYILDIVGAIGNLSDSGSQQVLLRFDAPGLGSTEFTVSISTNPNSSGSTGRDANGNFIQIIDNGTTNLFPGQTLKVVVTKDGNPLANATVFAALSSTFGTQCSNEIVGLTDSNGVALLGNIDPMQQYTIVVPAQNLSGSALNGFDFGTATVNHQISTQGPVVAINVTSVVSTGGTTIVATNLTKFPSVPFTTSSSGGFRFFTGPIINTPTSGLSPVRFFGRDDIGAFPRTNLAAALRDENVQFNQALTSSDGSVTVIFEEPVTIELGDPTASPRYEYQDNLRDPLTPGFNLEAFVAATATASPNGLNTIWTFSPFPAGTPLPANEVLNLRFLARSLSDSRVVSAGLVPPTDASAGTPPFGMYRPPGNTAITPPILDNYNGSRPSGAVTFTAGPDTTVFLVFDEVVAGSYEVLEIRDDAASPAVTTFTSSPVRKIGPRQGTSGTATNPHVLMVFNRDVAPNSGAAPGNAELSADPTAGKVRFLVALLPPTSTTPITLNDTQPGGPVRSVKLAISVKNATGATLDTVTALEVQ